MHAEKHLGAGVHKTSPRDGTASANAHPAHPSIVTQLHRYIRAVSGATRAHRARQRAHLSQEGDVVEV